MSAVWYALADAEHTEEALKKRNNVPSWARKSMEEAAAWQRQFVQESGEGEKWRAARDI
jgi:hypothetical protein